MKKLILKNTQQEKLLKVENELFTKKEIEKYKLNINYMELVEIKKSKVYWFFGARFSE